MSATSTRLVELAERLDAAAARTAARREDLAAGGRVRVVLVERYLALHGRADTTELARLFGVLDAERPGSWRWFRCAEDLRRAIGRVETAHARTIRS